MRTAHVSRILYEAISPSALTPYVCRSCKQNALHLSLSLSRSQQLRRASFSPRKLLEKIWPRKSGPDYPKNVTEAEEGLGPRKIKEIKIKYKPAQTWEELEHYGHSGEWWEIKPTERDSYISFTSKWTTAKKRPDLVSCLHRAITEHYLGQKPTEYDVHGGSFILAQSRVEIVTNEMGEIISAKPASKSDEILMANLGRLHQEDVEAAVDEISEVNEALVATLEDLRVGESYTFPPTGKLLASLEHKDVHFYYKVASESFLDCRLPERGGAKAKILGHFSQLAGLRIPDPLLNREKTLRDIIDHLHETVRPKPTTVAEILLSKREVTSLPNVKIMKRRESAILKEQEVGRLKLIEAELASRAFLLFKGVVKGPSKAAIRRN